MEWKEKYKIDENAEFGQYKSGKCEECGKVTSQVDAAMLWYGIPVYLCSNKCAEQHWRKLSR